MWDLAGRLTGQLRLAGGMAGGAVTGLDFSAALALAQALGINPLAVAELLPGVEASMVRGFNHGKGGADG